MHAHSCPIPLTTLQIHLAVESHALAAVFRPACADTCLAALVSVHYCSEAEVASCRHRRVHCKAYRGGRNLPDHPTPQRIRPGPALCEDHRFLPRTFQNTTSALNIFNPTYGSSYKPHHTEWHLSDVARHASPMEEVRKWPLWAFPPCFPHLSRARGDDRAHNPTSQLFKAHFGARLEQG